MSAAAVPKIRVAVATDVAAIVALAHDSKEIGYWTDGQYLEAIESTEEFVERRVWVAECGGRLVGFLAAMHVEGESATELENILVSAEMRRQGTAEALFSAFKQWTMEQGARAIALEVRESNGGAIAFYERLKFSVVGKRKGYYRDPEEDALTMWQDLAQMR